MSMLSFEIVGFLDRIIAGALVLDLCIQDKLRHSAYLET